MREGNFVRQKKEKGQAGRRTARERRLEAARQETPRISYIRKPMARNSIPCLGLALAAWLLGAAGLGISVRYQGDTPLGAVSLCFSSLLFAGAALYYGHRSLKEEEKNYMLARIGTAASGFLTILWAVMILIGLQQLL